MPFELTHQECLVVRLSALGDAILTTGVLKYWHEQAGLTFRVLTKPHFAPIFDNHPAVSGIISVEEKDLHGQGWVRFCRHLAHDHGHLRLVDLHANLRTMVLRLVWPGQARKYPKSSLIRRIFLTSGGRFFGARLRRANVPQRYSMALQDTPAPVDQVRPIVYLRPDETASARNLLHRLGLTRPIAIHPYATHPAKTPPPQVWQTAINLLRNAGHEVIVIGKSPASLVAGSSFDLTNSTDLRLTAALLSHCSGLLTGDSGPMHLGTAVSIPTIALFGPTTKEWGFYPSGPGDRVHQVACPQAPCSLHGQQACRLNNRCMTEIPPRLLVDLAGQLA